MPGPQFETPAEITALRTLGADVVGMSMALETIAARHAGAEVLGLAVVTNAAAVGGHPDRHRRGPHRGRRRGSVRSRDRAPRRRLTAVSTPLAPAGVDHVAINVPDVPGGIAFYTETLGLVQNFTRPDFGFAGAWLDTASGQQVHLIELEAPPNVGQHFALVYDDLEADGHRTACPGPQGHRCGRRRHDRPQASLLQRPVGKRDRAAPAALGRSHSAPVRPPATDPSRVGTHTSAEE